MAKYQVGRNVSGVKVPWSPNGGTPSNPVRLIPRPIADSEPFKSGPLGNIPAILALPFRGRQGTKNAVKRPALNPPFRIAPPETPFGMRPSKSLGGILKGVQDIANLHASVIPSNPIPYSILKEAGQKLNPAIKNPVAIESVLKRVTGVINGTRKENT